MLLISKKQLIPINANIAMVIICKLFQSRLQVGQYKSHGISQSCSCQGGCSIYYTCAALGRNLAQENTSWENPIISASLFLKIETFLDGGIAFAYAS